MNFFKMTMHIIAMISSTFVLAADNIDITAETGGYLNNNNNSDSIIKQDCINKLGNKKLLCENEKLNGKTPTAGTNSHLNKSRNRVTQENLKSNDMKSNDMTSKDMKSKDMKSKDMKSKDMKSQDMRSKDTKPNESNTIKSINSSSEFSK